MLVAIFLNFLFDFVFLPLIVPVFSQVVLFVFQHQTLGKMAANQNVTKKKKAVIGGIFKAELNNFLMKELAEDGYSGVEVSFLFESKYQQSLFIGPQHPSQS